MTQRSHLNITFYTLLVTGVFIILGPAFIGIAQGQTVDTGSIKDIVCGVCLSGHGLPTPQLSQEPREAWYQRIQDYIVQGYSRYRSRYEHLQQIQPGFEIDPLFYPRKGEAYHSGNLFVFFSADLKDPGGSSEDIYRLCPVVLWVLPGENLPIIIFS